MLCNRYAVADEILPDQVVLHIFSKQVHATILKFPVVSAFQIEFVLEFSVEFQSQHVGISFGSSLCLQKRRIQIHKLCICP
jgi:hypothetical protein